MSRTTEETRLSSPVDAESVSTKRVLEPWVMESVAFARALPPKKK
jgi:hypothetical protein